MSFRHQRPSLLRSLTLLDGRNAWAVAKGMGMSEAAFRARVARMSPDEAVSFPVEKRRSSAEVLKARGQYFRARDVVQAAAPEVHISVEDMKYYLDARSKRGMVFLAQSEDIRLYVNVKANRYIVHVVQPVGVSGLFPPDAVWQVARYGNVADKVELRRCLARQEAGEKLLEFFNLLPNDPFEASEMLAAGAIQPLLDGVPV